MKNLTLEVDGRRYSVLHEDEFSQKSIERYLKLQPLVPIDDKYNSIEGIAFEVSINRKENGFVSVALTPSSKVDLYGASGLPKHPYVFADAGGKFSPEKIEKPLRLFNPFENVYYTYRFEGEFPLSS